MLSVAVREIRNLIEGTSGPAREASEPIESAVEHVSGFSG